MDSMNSCAYSSDFMNLLNSQEESNGPDSFSPTIRLGSHFSDDPSTLVEQRHEGRRETRCKWKITEDKALISAWLNTSKDAVVGNEQKAAALWTRIANYYASCSIVAGLQKREASHYKQRWGKINDIVCKFVGSFEAAQCQKNSGQNEDDVLKLAYEIFYADHNFKFTLEHAWRELRNDQKWCGKGDGSSKRRKCDDGSTQSSSNIEDEAMARPPGVKASKAKAKTNLSKTSPMQKEGCSTMEFQSMWKIKKKDLAMKERIKKMGLLESLLGKGDQLSELEETLKNKLIREQLLDSTV